MVGFEILFLWPYMAVAFLKLFPDFPADTSLF
jgi:hypothetical protein